MFQHHLSSCPSTQEVLKEHFNIYQGAEFPLLISTDQQLAGRGRHGNQWLALQNSLSFSFTVIANEETPTLTSLEVAVAVVEYFQEQFGVELQIKWPNDLINSKGEKVGGILIQSLRENIYCCGIGLNWSDPQNELAQIERLETQYPAGVIFGPDQILSSADKKSFSLDLAESIHFKLPKLRTTDFKSRWLQYCSHLNTEVEIRDGARNVRGRFVGIGDLGEALLKAEDQIQRAFSGSLFVLNLS